MSFERSHLQPKNQVALPSAQIHQAVDWSSNESALGRVLVGMCRG